MEKEALGYENDEKMRTSAAASIAISLKRIADALEGTPEKLGLVDAISESITYAITNAARMQS